MTVVYILAHFDDEVGCLPAIWRAAAGGQAQRFLYVADYRRPRTAQRRLAETRGFLAAQGIDPDCAEHVGRGTGAWDGSVHRALPAAFQALQAALDRIGPVERLVAPAWEGGHMDHDMCALMAVRLSQARGGPLVEQFPFYNGRALPFPLLRALSPLAQNGPATPLALSGAERWRWLAQVWRFPSQAFAWAGIWPMMALRLARHGFAPQRLDPARVEERPHAGPLFYERMFRVPYAEVRAAADAALPRPSPVS